MLQGIDACDGRSGLEFRPALEVALLRVSSYVPGLVDESAGGGIARPLERRLERWTATGIVMSALVIKRGILFFWALWFSLVLATNVTDGLKALQVLPQSWAFTSGNFALMTTVTAIYHTPIWIVAILFLGSSSGKHWVRYFSGERLDSFVASHPRDFVRCTPHLG